ncbi:MAG: hypothetical protein B6D58_00630 [candidate division Zixibacteria bacterium 4484_95]|nr:MAG: hypothetical protein B6D58_00630 [candidate division Zixibacteria bacterium 4484_95]
MKRNYLIFIVVAVICLAVFAQADVIIKQKTSIESSAIMNIEINGVEYIKGDKNYSSSSTNMVGGMMAMMGKKTTSEFIQITRLDKDVIWDLDPQNKTYSESSLASLQQMMAGTGQTPESENEDETSEYNWTLDVKTSDKDVEINGFKCTGIIGKATGINKNNPEDKMRLTYEYWYAKDVPGLDELEDYHNKFSKATGFDITMPRQHVQKIFNKYGSQFDKMTEKMQGVEGYPIKTVILVESTKGVEGGEGDYGEEMPPGMKEMLSGLSNKKQSQKSESDMIKVFSLSNEILSIEKKNVDDSKFEIPEGYKKKETH